MSVTSELKCFDKDTKVIMPYSERNTLEKRKGIISGLELHLNKISVDDKWFNVLCFGSFLTDRYCEGSNINLVVCAEDEQTLFIIKDYLTAYLLYVGLEYAIEEETWPCCDEIPDYIAEWLGCMTIKWGLRSMRKFYDVTQFKCILK